MQLPGQRPQHRVVGHHLRLREPAGRDIGSVGLQCRRPRAVPAALLLPVHGRHLPPLSVRPHEAVQRGQGEEFVVRGGRRQVQEQHAFHGHLRHSGALPGHLGGDRL